MIDRITAIKNLGWAGLERYDTVEGQPRSHERFLQASRLWEEGVLVFTFKLAAKIKGNGLYGLWTWKKIAIYLKMPFYSVILLTVI